METLTSLEQWGRWAADGRAYNKLPYVRRYALGEGEDRVLRWQRAWEAASAHAFVLESGKDGRYTFLGLKPTAVIRGTSGEATEAAAGAEAGNAVSAGDACGRRHEDAPLAVMREVMARCRAPSVPGAPKFLGGCVGYWSYDVARSLERLPELAANDLGLPDYAFLLVDELWIVDHEARALYLAVHADVPKEAEDETLRRAMSDAAGRADEMKRIWDRVAAGRADAAASAAVEAMKAAMAEDGLELDVKAFADAGHLRTSMSKEIFKQAVRRIQAYIGQGDVFQVNLSMRQSMPVAARPEDLYELLRLINPSPYMGFLKFPDFQLVSASPELLVKREGDRIGARPIAGTRRRGRTPDEDAAMERELLASEKERAEHVMLVDLARNDLGRVAAYGSVRVPELLTVERYSHVMHLVSQVEGRIAPGWDAFDVLAGSFPGGTITGAPKIRTMEIIEELEPVRRGVYTGSLGWIDYAGNMEFNIIIRTMVAKDGIVHIQAGAGIVIDSDPEREFYECLNKAKALWKAVQYGERLRDRKEPVHLEEGRS
ncbi:anthranilate synthase component I family protein [Cohnella nanjingensis]|uniref:Anthranilate synthase component I family protein n=1 Tax=Cohnella nanjingensis TaxID=1387779 RepID=A0A7X0RLQ1_9BACL|nr:anthranilate synthase component I family protein [Cohnella nanjingensis]